MWTCSSCGDTYDDKYGFCPKDGTPPTYTKCARLKSEAREQRKSLIERLTGKPCHPSNEIQPAAPCKPPSVTEPRKFMTPCLPPSVEDVERREREKYADSVNRMSDEFRNLSAEEQHRATILSAKRKPAVSGDAEAKASEQPDDGGCSKVPVEPHLSEATT
jgi:hypothetical protein